ncbi:glycosyltransferase family 2 protein [Paracoccus sp. (in: a-proteobacteria)]|uniref:glycosyltransferase family 2 protein n=1 Tax=Paracoccus sp. TaxID=267 RepID=UPI003A8631ED
MPLFSIILPCFNAAATLPETLLTLSVQTFTDWELLCIDDGSTDETSSILARAAAGDARIRVIRNPGKGPSAARNLALTEARGEIFAFCDADDLWVPQKLSIMAALMRDKGIDGAYARVQFFSETRSRSLSTVPQGLLSVAMLLSENPVCTMSNVVIRAGAFRKVGGFDENLVFNEDLEWLIRLVAQGHRIMGIDETLVFYRTSTSGLSSDLIAMYTSRQAALFTAMLYGYVPDDRAEAIYLRYLARRALRVGAPGFTAMRYVIAGMMTSTRGFFSGGTRGVLTFAAALIAPLLPTALRRRLFAC